MNETPFPADVLPAPFRNLAEATASAYRVPLVLPAVAGLTVASAALGKGLRLQSADGRYLNGNLYTLLSADSGSITGQSLLVDGGVNRGL